MEKNCKCSKKVRYIIVLILVLLLLAAAAVGAHLAMRLRLPEQAEICGVDLSDMLLSDAALLLEEKVTGYSMKLTVGDQVMDVTAEDLGIVFLKEEFEGVVQSAVDMGTEIDPWSVITLDEQKLTSYISENFDEGRTPAVSAVVVWDEGENCFNVESGAPETWYSSELLTAMVRDALADLPAELEIAEDALYQEYTDAAQLEAAEALAQKANGLMTLNLEYVFNPRGIELGREVIDSATITSFLRIDQENNSVYADEAAVLAYVEGFASKYSYTGYRDRFVTHDGKRADICVNTQKRSVDREALVRLISDCIANGTSGTFDAPYTGALNFEGNYIEVSIPEQHLWVYENGEVVLDTVVVTGTDGIHDTPTGIRAVRGHLKDIFLKPGYFVEYWMSFTTGGTHGFHDADYWREPEEYASDTYKTNGSGGCVNVPVEKMAELYELVPDGTPVVLYNYFHFD